MTDVTINPGGVTQAVLGVPGPQGDIGTQGNTGPQGTTGDAGATGATGATGPQGATGATGPQGNTGQQGNTGAQGNTGSIGPQGSPGAGGLKENQLYTNDGGQGDRQSLITVTASSGLLFTPGGGVPSSLVDGASGQNNVDSIILASVSAANHFLQFDFSLGASKVITEATWTQSHTTKTYGVWKWQGSHDATSWVDIGNSFTLGGMLTQVQTELSANAVGYRYYRLFGVSGSFTAAGYIQEITFKIAATNSNKIVGLITGGTTGQMLVKTSSTEYDMSWALALLSANSGTHLKITGQAAGDIPLHLAPNGEATALKIDGHVFGNSNKPLFDWASTWNHAATGVPIDFIKLAITDTESHNRSNIIKITRDGFDLFFIRGRDGRIEMHDPAGVGNPLSLIRKSSGGISIMDGVNPSGGSDLGIVDIYWETGTVGNSAVIKGGGTNRLSIESAAAMVHIAQNSRYEWEGLGSNVIQFTGYQAASAIGRPIEFGNSGQTVGQEAVPLYVRSYVVTTDICHFRDNTDAVVAKVEIDGSIQGKLKTNAAAVAATPTPTHTIVLYDSTGTAYRVPCVV